jgi:hypothetical protein
VDKEMEFYISGSVNGETGFLSIIGRCGKEPIRPGVEFHAILKEKPRLYPDGLELPREIEKCKSIRIKVQEVEVYGKKVEMLPANTTGVLRCVDYSVDLVPGGWILTDQCVTANA